MRPPQHLALVLPYKERFTGDGAGAVSLSVRDALSASRYRGHARVYGQQVEATFEGIAFTAVEPRRTWLLGRERAYGRALAPTLAQASGGLVEVHNRAATARRLAHACPHQRVSLWVHNDPHTMGGLRSSAARRRLLDRLAGVVCVSEHVRRRFLDGLEDRADRVRVVVNAVPPIAVDLRAKQPLIAFAGRAIAEKGLDHLAEALAAVLPGRPGWRARIIGARWFGTGQRPTAFERRVAALLAPVRERVELEGWQPHDVVLSTFAEAAIVVVPSVWDEPFGRVAAEGLAAGCAVLAYRRGGLEEIIAGRGILVDEPDPGALTVALARLLDDAPLRQRLQARARSDLPFTPERAAAAADRWRDELLASAAP